MKARFEQQQITPRASRVLSFVVRLFCGTSVLGGMLGCPAIDGQWQGDLIVKSIEDIDAAKDVLYVTGDLIVDDSNLTSLAGLEGILEVDGALVIGGDNGNRSLASLNGLSGLTIVRKHALVKKNAVLVDLGGLSGLESVGESFAITQNSLLSTMGTMSALSSVGDFFSITENPSLQNFAGLTGLLDVEFTLAIESNGVLSSIDGMTALRSAGRLFVRQNPALPTCQATTLRDRLLSVAGLSRYDGLVDIDGNLVDACSVDITN